jgi:hypothetical protein
MRRQLLLVSVLFAVLLSGCVSGDIGGGISEYYTLSVELIEKETGLPLRSSLVMFEPDRLWRTDAQGRIERYVKGRVEVTPVAAGWQFEPSSFTASSPNTVGGRVSLPIFFLPNKG